MDTEHDSAQRGPQLPLAMLGEGETAHIVGVKGASELRQHLATLGFVDGAEVSVAKLTGTGAVKRRIMDMGLTKGTEVHVKKVAPLGDPIELTVRGYELSIRKDEAASIEVTDVH